MKNLMVVGVPLPDRCDGTHRIEQVYLDLVQKLASSRSIERILVSIRCTIEGLFLNRHEVHTDKPSVLDHRENLCVVLDPDYGEHIPSYVSSEVKENMWSKLFLLKAIALTTFVKRLSRMIEDPGPGWIWFRRFIQKLAIKEPKAIGRHDSSLLLRRIIAAHNPAAPLIAEIRSRFRSCTTAWVTAWENRSLPPHQSLHSPNEKQIETNQHQERRAPCHKEKLFNCI